MSIFTESELQSLVELHLRPLPSRLAELTEKNCVGGGLTDDERLEYEALWSERQAITDAEWKVSL